MKKISIIFTVIIITLLFVTSASAATDGYYTYEVENGQAVITSADKEISGDIVIPEVLGGYPVTAIAESAFYDCNKITSLIIPSSVTVIGQYAFYNCSSLKEIDIPDSLISMGADVFSNGIIDLTNDESEYIDGGKYVDGWLVKYVSTDSDVKAIEIANGTVGIADGAFTLAPYIHEITFADSVKYIGAYITQGVQELKKVKWGNSIISIGDRAFENCYYLGDTLTLPDTLQTIGEKAFRNCQYLWYINFGSSLKSIGNNAFEKCTALTEITLPKNIEHLGDYVFYDCINLQEIFWECTAKTGKGVFQNTQLTDVVLPSGIKNLPEDTFNNCYSLTTIVIPKTIEIISKNAFKDSGLTTVFYEGTKTQWNKIKTDNADGGNETLLNAEKKFNYSTEHTHSYSEKRTKKATLKQNGEFIYTCSCGHSYTKSIPRINVIKLSKENYVYNGKAKTPSVEVRDLSGKKLTKGSDYTLTYESGRKAIGKYSVKITFKGNYSGSKVLEFIIRPAKVSKLSVKKNPTTAVLTWSKVEKATGYAVYKYDSAKQKWVRLKKTTALTYTIKGLNDISTYNFAVKAYTKTGDGEIYSLEYKKFLLDQSPKAPTIKSISSSAKGEVKISWGKVKDADGYNVCISSSPNGTPFRIASIKGGSNLKTTISGLKSKQKFYIKVQAYRTSVSGANVYSAFSTIYSFKTK